MYRVYILYSDSLGKYYVGQTKDLEERLERHNQGREKYTKRGIPWLFIASFACSSRSEGMRLESKIKRRGIKRFFEDNNRGIAQSG